MSAYLVDTHHIDALVMFMVHRRVSIHLHPVLSNQQHDYGSIGTKQTTKVGEALLAENVRSLKARYNSAGQDELDAPNAYNWTPYMGHLDPVQILKACDCYDYQACEADDYYTTWAADVIQRIRKEAIRMLPGYDDADWGMPLHNTGNVVSIS